MNGLAVGLSAASAQMGDHAGACLVRLIPAARLSAGPCRVGLLEHGRNQYRGQRQCPCALGVVLVVVHEVPGEDLEYGQVFQLHSWRRTGWGSAA